MSEHRGGHQPFTEGPFLHDLTPLFGSDVYAHPEWYAFGEGEDYFTESRRVFLAVRDQPDAIVTVYRAVPPGVTAIEPGDWVAISEAYARQHAIQNNDPADDWPVISRQVRAGEVCTGGSDIIEWGWTGPSV